jgi:hypothetical protein
LRVDPAAFLALTAAIAACHRSEAPVAPPPSAVATTVTSVDASVPPAPAAPSASASPVPTALATNGEPDAGPDILGDYLEGLHDAGACEEQKLGHVRGPHEGTPKVLDPLAEKCWPLEVSSTGQAFPSSCDEGAIGCATMVNSLSIPVGQRVLACLRAKKGTALCAKGVVRDCVLVAMAPVRARPGVEPVCETLVHQCAAAGKSLDAQACVRFVSSMRKCHGFERAVSGLAEMCDVGACLDDWTSTWSY